LYKNTNEEKRKVSLRFFPQIGFPPKTITKSAKKGFIHEVSHIIHQKITYYTPVFYGNHRMYVLVKIAEYSRIHPIFNSLIEWG
jgi:hypothetical protein